MLDRRRADALRCNAGCAEKATVDEERPMDRWAVHGSIVERSILGSNPVVVKFEIGSCFVNGMVHLRISHRCFQQVFRQKRQKCRHV
jgi:hypothetical protein